jgi:2-polyprenyl-3-methyl-5-hydroxy-6-metoxy-1,4-benzoquinol methylase
VIPGTQGYAEQADELVQRYESLAFADKHQAVLHLLPDAPAQVLDIGAGTGTDAAWLALRGHQVVAVEPTREMRAHGMALHPSTSIEWVDDSLPRLEQVARRQQRFELVMLISVWMHLDEDERRLAMPNVASLMAPNGVLVMSLRHGPVPDGRRMFKVSATETIALAQACGLRNVLNVHAPSALAVNRAAGVTSSRLAFRSPVP